MAKPSWQDVLRSVLAETEHSPSSRYVQLATVGLDGGPRNRTIVFRGFVENSDQLLAVTDARNAKFEELRRDPRVELCWYFVESRQQFRIRAEAVLLDEDNRDSQRQALWATLGEATSEQFFWAYPGEEVGESRPIPMTPGPPDHFVGLRFIPQQVDHLSLHKPQTRVRWLRHADGWQATDINP